MVDKKQDIIFWEKHGWDSYGRYLAVKTLSEEISREISTRYLNDGNGISTLLRLLTTPKYVIDVLSQKFPIEVGEAFLSATDGVKFIVWASYLRITMLRLLEACTKPDRIVDIPLDIDEPIRRVTKGIYGVPQLGDMRADFAHLFGNNNDLLIQATQEAKTGGINLLLSKLEKEDTPLGRWSYSLLWRRRLTFKETMDLGLTTCLPTRFDGIDLRFYYPPDINTPQLSLVVNPLPKD